MSTNTADLDTIFTRLKAKNDQIDRQLEAALKRQGLTRDKLTMMGSLSTKLDPHKTKAAEAQFLAQLAVDPKSWDEVSRPSLSSMTQSRNLQRLRG